MLRTVSRAVRAFGEAQISLRAAALAFHSLLALVPSLCIALWYLRLIGVTGKWVRNLRGFVLSNLNVTSSESVLKTFERLSNSSATRGWSWVVWGVLVYTAYNLVVKFGDGLDAILDSTHIDSSFAVRPIRWEDRLWLFLRRTVLLLTLPVALFISLWVASWLRNDSWLRYLFDIQSVGSYLAAPIPWLIDIMGLTLVYHFVPRREVSFRAAFRAALIIGPTLELAKFILAFYSRNALTVQKLYGALAVIPLLIVWVQLAWIITLSGALFIRAESAQLRR